MNQLAIPDLAVRLIPVAVLYPERIVEATKPAALPMIAARIADTGEIDVFHKISL
jgi:hypothetical protein